MLKSIDPDKSGGNCIKQLTILQRENIDLKDQINNITNNNYTDFIENLNYKIELQEDKILENNKLLLK